MDQEENRPPKKNYEIPMSYLDPVVFDMAADRKEAEQAPPPPKEPKPESEG